jgi:hypothetical protein
MRRLFCAIVIAVLWLDGPIAHAQNVAKVQVTAVISDKVPSFKDQRLVISLAHDFPLQDDRGNKTVDRHINAKFSHEQGTATVVTMILGEKVKLNPGVHYFVTLSVFGPANKVTHVATREDQSTQFPVITFGSPSQLKLTVRPVQ